MKTLTERHHLISETTFHLKKWLLTINRAVRNLAANTQKFTANIHHKDASVIAVSDSELWNADDNELNWILTAGKVQNLRLAAQQINGLEIPANQIFSFWKHIGNPNFGKGYVIGREIREGCIVPTIAGGLCQLSNALYDAALKANFEIIERHKHTQVIKGSLAEQDRDATVKWNYLDLRFRSGYDFRIAVDMTADRLIVTFRSNSNEKSKPKGAISNQSSSKLNDCYSCGNYQCFKHPNGIETKRREAVTTFILDDKWPEFDAYVKSISTDKNFFIVPLRKSNLIKAERYNWSASNSANVKALTYAAIKRSLKTRFAKAGANVFALSLKHDEKLAKAAAKLIPMKVRI